MYNDNTLHCGDICIPTQIAGFLGPIWGPSGADKTQVGPKLAHEPCYLGIVTD